MPKAIKAFAINNTAAATTTIYTCPASTVARAIVSFAYLKNSASLNLGFFSIATSSTGELGVNPSQSVSSGTTVYAQVPALEMYLSAGQTITTIVGAGGSAKAQICIIEEVAS